MSFLVLIGSLFDKRGELFFRGLYVNGVVHDWLGGVKTCILEPFGTPAALVGDVCWHIDGVELVVSLDFVKFIIDCTGVVVLNYALVVVLSVTRASLHLLLEVGRLLLVPHLVDGLTVVLDWLLLLLTVLLALLNPRSGQSLGGVES